jgi:hypothetical protein
VSVAPEEAGTALVTATPAVEQQRRELLTRGWQESWRRGRSRGSRPRKQPHHGVARGDYDAHRRIEEIRCKKSSEVGDSDGFPAFSARHLNLLLPEKFKPLGITKYEAKQDPVQWLSCYALSIENVGGNDTKCLYFPFCLDQAPLTWLESLDKNTIHEWDQLKAQFTSTFTGAMGCSGTHMDLAMVKQEQGETLCKYMRRFSKTSVVAI